jgi:hypothetical protein
MDSSYRLLFHYQKTATFAADKLCWHSFYYNFIWYIWFITHKRVTGSLDVRGGKVGVVIETSCWYILTIAAKDLLRGK